MKSVRVSDRTHKFLKQIAEQERRTIAATLDLFVEIYEEAHDKKVASKGLPRKSAK